MRRSSNPQETLPPLNVSVTTAARLLGVSRPTVYRLLRDGKLENIWLGQRRLVRFSSIEAFSAALPCERPAPEGASSGR